MNAASKRIAILALSSTLPYLQYIGVRFRLPVMDLLNKSGLSRAVDRRAMSMADDYK
jgi:hypothetical protein